MTVNKETEAEVLRLFHAEKWRPTTIAMQLQLHHSTVQRVLSSSGVPITNLKIRPSKVDSYIPFILATLEKYSKLTAARLYMMVKERGYDGAGSRFQAVIAQIRPRPAAEAYMRTATLPGEQAQCDWAHFGRVRFGNAERRLLAFVMVMSWSRHIFLRFYTGDAMPNFLGGHVDAFEFFGAVPREILYDNLRSAVLERYGSAIRFNPQLLDLAAYYRFQPKPTGVRSPQEKDWASYCTSLILLTGLFSWTPNWFGFYGSNCLEHGLCRWLKENVLSAASRYTFKIPSFVQFMRFRRIRVEHFGNFFSCEKAFFSQALISRF